MTNAIQTKLLLGILAALIAIASLLYRGGRHIEPTKEDRQLQLKFENAVKPAPKPYLVP
jgi:hypothetical protein